MPARSRAGPALLIGGALIAGVLIGGVALGRALTAVEGLTSAPASTASPIPTTVPSASLPSGDQPGDDLARLPRYPGAVRSAFEIIEEGGFRLTAAEYLADAGLDEVRAFYQGAIAGQGWQRADIGYSGGEWTFVLVDGSTEALVQLEVTRGLIEIDLQVSEPMQTATTQPAPPPPPPPPAPPQPPPGDDDDSGGDDDGDD